MALAIRNPMHYKDKSLNALKLGQQTKYAEKYDRTLLQPCLL